MMTIRKAVTASIFAMTLAAAGAAPALAQESSYVDGDYWEVSSIELQDGQGEVYADYLADRWRASQEFAKERGWIKGYHVLQNINNRDDEPDLYLVTIFESFPSRAEEVQRDAAFEAWAQANTRQLEAQSAGRATMRRLAGSLLLRELELKAPN
ncbi:MAG: hypothetical protein ACXW3O_15985 [Brevundimonas sp.]